jgi:hypothetical protein
MDPEPKQAQEESTEAETEAELRTFINRLDSGEFDGRLFEEIRKLRAEHLARVCRLLSKRKFGDPEV